MSPQKKTKQPFLKKKILGVPAPVVLVVAGVGALYLYKKYKGNQSTSPSAAGLPLGNTVGSGYGGGDTSGGGGSAGGSAPPADTTPASQGYTSTGTAGTVYTTPSTDTTSLNTPTQGYDPATGLLAGQPFINPYTTSPTTGQDYLNLSPSNPLIATGVTSSLAGYTGRGTVSGVSTPSGTLQGGH